MAVAPRRHRAASGATLAVADMKAEQAAKIWELGNALVTAGLLTLDAQAEALGLSRSTAWCIHKANHKASGLSATVVNRMLASPRLPPRARAIILEYVAAKAAGAYGGSKAQRRRFVARLSIAAVAPAALAGHRSRDHAPPKPA
jgi:hypothetical protein